MIKVPVDQFEGLLNYLTLDKNNKVLEKQVGSNDVSAQYIDTKSRLETKKHIRAKYYELLSQAKKMDDILRVQQEINTITEDIEAATGRLEYLANQSAYSTINLHYFQVLNASKVNNNPPSFFIQLAHAFKEGASLIGNMILMLVYIWPILLAAVLVLYLVRRNKLLKL